MLHEPVFLLFYMNSCAMKIFFFNCKPVVHEITSLYLWIILSMCRSESENCLERVGLKLRLHLQAHSGELSVMWTFPCLSHNLVESLDYPLHHGWDRWELFVFSFICQSWVPQIFQMTWVFHPAVPSLCWSSWKQILTRFYLVSSHEYHV